MSRQSILLSAVGAVLVLALYWMFLLSPKRTELADIQDQTEAVITEQRNLTSQINTLKDIRARAPEVEARLAASEALVPSGPALSPTIRQLQTAADEAGLILNTISPSAPSGGLAGIRSMSLSLSLRGSYFQVIDFLRRIEDPAITPRAIIWNSMTLGPSEYPVLSVSLAGTMYVLDRDALAASGEGEG